MSLVKHEVKVWIDGTPEEDQMEITLALPVICQDDVEGFDLSLIVERAMEVYKLPKSGVQVEYLAKSIGGGMWYFCDNLFSDKANSSNSNSGGHLTVPQ